MASIVSTLTMRLLDAFSPNAGKVAKSAGDVDKAMRRVSKSMGEKGGLEGFLAGGRNLVAATGGFYGISRGVMSASRAFASFDRQMTRIGITAEASTAQVASASQEVKSLANDVALPLDDVVKGLDALVAAGRSLPEAMGFLPAVARTAQAAGAETADIANSADAIASSFGVAGDRMQSAFDILVAGGKAGKFELKDMASYIPSLAPAMAALGYKGEEGLSKLVAMLQVVRTQTGDASSAATNLQNVLQKMTSEATVKKFAEMGVDDLRGQLDAARAAGKDVIQVFLDLTQQATKGDLSKINLLFTDAQMQQGVRALMSQRDLYKEIFAVLKDADGSVMKDLQRVTGDAASSMERFSNATGNAGQSLGKLADAAGFTSMLEGIASAADSAAGRLDNLSTRGKQIGMWGAVQESRDAGTMGMLEKDDPRAKAFIDAYRGKTGSAPDLSEALGWASNAYTALFRNVEDVVREAAEAGISAAERDIGKRYESLNNGLSGRHGTNPAGGRVVRTSAEAGDYGGEFDFTRNGRPGFNHGDARIDLKEPGGLSSSGETSYSPSAYEAPVLRPPTVGSVDLSPQAELTMGSYRDGLNSQMKAAEADVDAFVGRIQSKLSFSASPKVSVSLSASDAGVPSTQTKSFESGKKVSAMMRGGYEDSRLS
jgi:TP901 family phage tail tape measure protein